jgi:hypothetical protein
MTAMTRLIRSLALCGLALSAACTPLSGTRPGTGALTPPALITIQDRELPSRLTFIAYGDMRFTPTTETRASWPAVRQALVARVAAEKPAALLLSGDLPFHGGSEQDYAVFAQETRAWRDQGLRVYPALGNHEFSQCPEAQCLENWWTAFPALRGHRWYSVALGSQILCIALDSDTSLEPGTRQREWLEQQVSSLPRSVRYVLVSLHHPPVADLASGKLADHNPRPNEIALASYLSSVSGVSRARFVVVAGHTHNYERLEKDGVVYLVSGGGGAAPYPVERSPQDLYQGKDEINFHYIRFTLGTDRLSAEMVRVADPEAAAPTQFVVSDRFEVRAR